MKNVIKHLLSTEKAVRVMEAENKLVFVVENDSTKADIKKSIETDFKVKVMAVNTTIMPDGKKKAYIKLAKENPALDIATQLGAI